MIYMRNLIRKPIFILGVFLLLALVAIGVLVLVRFKAAPQDEIKEPSQQEEPVERASGRYIETVSLFPQMAFYVENQGEFIAFLENWGAYSEKDRIRITIMNQAQAEPEGVEGSFVSTGEGFDNYNILLDEVGAADQRLVMEEFLSLFYDSRIDPDVDEINKEEFMQAAREELGSQNYFVITPRE